jgi:hypothetical protein
MPSKAIGEFSLKSITSTLTPGPGGSVLNTVNWEGTATGFGTLFLTSTFVGGTKSGTFSLSMTSFLDNGDGVDGNGSGRFESIGKNRWRSQAVTTMSDGRRVSGDGEIDLASRTWKGKISELS